MWPSVAPPSPPLSERTIAILRRAVGRRFHISAVAGDASTRRFFRARGRRGTAIVIAHPEPLGPSSGFRSNHRVLSDLGAPVPKLIGADEKAGLLIVADLGNTTLQRHLRRSRGRPSAATWRRLYRRACDLIVLLQRGGQVALRRGDFALHVSLDRDRFLSELDHFHRHFVIGLQRRRPPPGDEAILRSFYAGLAEECARLPRVYCHRDFQSRNLMVRAGTLHLIDYQDARMGPYTYDAASLLRDSSLDLEEDLVQEMIEYLAERLRHGPEEFRRDFDRVALQRNIKDLGTFAFMATSRARRDYLEYVPRTIRSIRRTLLRCPRNDVVYPHLERYVLGRSG